MSGSIATLCSDLLLDNWTVADFFITVISTKPLSIWKVDRFAEPAIIKKNTLR